MNINFDDLERLIKIAERADIHALEVSEGDTHISIICQSNDAQSQHPQTTHSQSSNPHLNDRTNSDNKNSNPPSEHDSATNEETPAKMSAKDDSNKKDTDKNTDHQVVAPMLGTFYRRASPGAEAFVQAGDGVEAGQTLCIIEAMKMMHEVKAEVSGVITDILLDEGEVAEYGQALLVLQPED